MSEPPGVPGTPAASDPYAHDPGRTQPYGSPPAQPVPGQWPGAQGGTPQPGGSYPGQQPGSSYPGQQPGSSYPGQQPGGDATTPMPPTQPQSPSGWPPADQPYQPGVASPSYQQQQYEPTSYQPAQYPPSGYDQGAPYGPPGYQPEPPKSRATAVMVTAIVLVVAVIAGLAAWLGTRSSGTNATNTAASQNPSSAPISPATSPTTPSAAPSSPRAGGASTVYTLPHSAAGMTLRPDSGVADLFSKSLPGGLVGGSTAGLYQDSSNPQKILFLFGAETAFPATKAAVNGAFAGFSGESGAHFSKPKAYSAGSMGGVLECSSGTIAQLGSGVPVSVCVVGDSHGLIVALYTDRTASSAATATRTIRPSFEHQ